MPLKIGCSRDVIAYNTNTLIHEGYPPRAAYAIANDLARKHKKMCPVNPPKRKPPKRKAGKKKGKTVSFKTKGGKRVTFKTKKKKASAQGSIFGLF